jgi:hypothetical protein
MYSAAISRNASLVESGFGESSGSAGNCILRAFHRRVIPPIAQGFAHMLEENTALWKKIWVKPLILINLQYNGKTLSGMARACRKSSALVDVH